MTMSVSHDYDGRDYMSWIDGNPRTQYGYGSARYTLPDDDPILEWRELYNAGCLTSAAQYQDDGGYAPIIERDGHTMTIDYKSTTAKDRRELLPKAKRSRHA